jgi:hypothetical protein
MKLYAIKVLGSSGAEFGLCGTQRPQSETVAVKDFVGGETLQLRNRISEDEVAGYFAIILFMFYPVRYIIIVILWALKTLRN